MKNQGTSIIYLTPQTNINQPSSISSISRSSYGVHKWPSPTRRFPHGAPPDQSSVVIQKSAESTVQWYHQLVIGNQPKRISKQLDIQPKHLTKGDLALQIRDSQRTGQQHGGSCTTSCHHGLKQQLSESMAGQGAISANNNHVWQTGKTTNQSLCYICVTCKNSKIRQITTSSLSQGQSYACRGDFTMAVDRCSPRVMIDVCHHSQVSST